MRKINLKDVPEQEKKSPKGKFGRITKNISVALGREPESLDLSKRHPFDLALVRIPKANSFVPITHMRRNRSFTWCFLVAAACATHGIIEVEAGDAFSFNQGKRISFGIRMMRTLFIM